MKEITCRTCSRSSRPRSCCFGARRPPDELFSLIKKISFFKKIYIVDLHFNPAALVLLLLPLLVVTWIFPQVPQPPFPL